MGEKYPIAWIVPVMLGVLGLAAQATQVKTAAYVLYGGAIVTALLMF